MKNTIKLLVLAASGLLLISCGPKGTKTSSSTRPTSSPSTSITSEATSEDTSEESVISVESDTSEESVVSVDSSEESVDSSEESEESVVSSEESSEESQESQESSASEPVSSGWTLNLDGKAPIELEAFGEPGEKDTWTEQYHATVNFSIGDLFVITNGEESFGGEILESTVYSAVKEGEKVKMTVEGEQDVYFKIYGNETPIGHSLYITGGSAPEVTYKTYYFSNNKSWEKVYLYAWKGANKNAEWPGVEMTYHHTNEHSEQVFALEIDDSMECLIFNNGSGQQTEDIAVADLEGNNGVYLTGDSTPFGYGVWNYVPAE